MSAVLSRTCDSFQCECMPSALLIARVSHVSIHIKYSRKIYEKLVHRSGIVLLNIHSDAATYEHFILSFNIHYLTMLSQITFAKNITFAIVATPLFSLPCWPHFTLN